MNRILVIGTGTEIGKTHASIALSSALSTMGISITALKPIESGVPLNPKDASTDSGSLAAFSSYPATSPPYAFPDPVSPHLAARWANITIDLDRIKQWVDSHTPRVVLVETAGAVLSPIDKGTTNLDLVRKLQPTRVLLVAPDRLGVLHDVTAALHAYRTLAPELPEPLVLLQPPAASDTSTGTNAEELVWLGITPKVFVFPRAKPTDRAVHDVVRNILAAWNIAEFAKL
jgi:dethiobiotin synthetase